MRFLLVSTDEAKVSRSIEVPKEIVVQTSKKRKTKVARLTVNSKQKRKQISKSVVKYRIGLGK